MPKCLKVVIPLVILVLWPGTMSLMAQWQDNGLPICTGNEIQKEPSVLAFSDGSSIVVWSDRSGGNYDIYAKKLNRDGNAVWGADAVAICADARAQRLPKIVESYNGSAIIVWLDRGADNYYYLYARKINGNGSIAWGAKVPVCTKSKEPYVYDRYCVTSDGAGGAVIAWMDFRFGGSNIFAQRITESGSAAWSQDGVRASGTGTSSDRDYGPQILEDGHGGAIIAWYDGWARSSDVNLGIYVQRVASNGSVLWGQSGKNITTASRCRTHPYIVSDMNGGAILAWWDSPHCQSGCQWDIYAQRIDDTGTIIWNQIVPICTNGAKQDIEGIISDNQGGAIIVWEDARNGNRDIYAQRINGAGNTLWDSNGKPVCVAARDQVCHSYIDLNNPIVASDGASGAYIAWQDYRLGSTCDVYCQWVDATGSTKWGASGKPVCTATSDQDSLSIVSPAGSGSAIVVWHDKRSGEYDIYASRLMPEAPFISLSLPSSPIIVDPGESVNISWTASDSDNNALIALAYDDDCSPGGHVWITSGIPEDGPDNTYSWNTAGVPPGTYRIWAVIDDSQYVPFYSCAPGSVTIQDTRSPIISISSPSTSTGVFQGQSVEIEWVARDSDDNASISLAYDADCTPGEHQWIATGIPEDDPNSSLSWNTSEVPTGTYRIWAKIEDSQHAPFYSCAAGTVTVWNRPVAVLIHGIFGGEGTWGDETNNLKALLEIEGYDVRYFNYPQGWDADNYQVPIETLAGQLKDSLDEINSTTPFGEGGTQLYVVAHSMGGLIAKYYLTLEDHYPIDKLVLIGTPNYGSSFAELGSTVPIHGGYQAFEMEYGSEFLWDLQSDTRDMLCWGEGMQYLCIAGAVHWGLHWAADGVVSLPSATHTQHECPSFARSSGMSAGEEDPHDVFYVPYRHAKICLPGCHNPLCCFPFPGFDTGEIAYITSADHETFKAIVSFLETGSAPVSSEDVSDLTEGMLLLRLYYYDEQYNPAPISIASTNDWYKLEGEEWVSIPKSFFTNGVNGASGIYYANDLEQGTYRFTVMPEAGYNWIEVPEVTISPRRTTIFEAYTEPTGINLTESIAPGDAAPVLFYDAGLSLDFAAGPGGSVSVYGSEEDPPVKGNLVMLARYWEIDSDIPDSTFTATIKFAYDEAELADLGIDESSLMVAYFDTIWHALNSDVDMLNDSVSTTVNHFSIYAIMACEDELVSTLLQSYELKAEGSDIRIIWTVSGDNEERKYIIHRAEGMESTFEELTGIGYQTKGMTSTALDMHTEPGATYRYRVDIQDTRGQRLLFETEARSVPSLPVTLFQNHPNPFNPSTTIRYYLPEKCRVELEVYDVSGRRLVELARGLKDKGSHETIWNGKDQDGNPVGSGVYFYRLNAGKKSISRKMVLLR